MYLIRFSGPFTQQPRPRNKYHLLEDHPPHPAHVHQQFLPTVDPPPLPVLPLDSHHLAHRSPPEPSLHRHRPDWYSLT